MGFDILFSGYWRCVAEGTIRLRILKGSIGVCLMSNTPVAEATIRMRILKVTCYVHDW